MNWLRVVGCYGLGVFSTCFATEYSSVASTYSTIDLPEFNGNSVPVVLTATRIQQHQSDVPASVTVLDSEFIKNLGTNNLAEVLRYVPGIMLGPDKSNNLDSLNYHGGESSLSKNLQVLVDGRSMYRAGLASVSWYEMPVAIKDIDRIEVVRGPNSASYGANAYQAVINILTKHPSDTYGSSVSLEAGEYGQQDVYLKQGGRVLTADYRISYTSKRNSGFDNVNDTRHSQFVNAETYQDFGSFGELDLSLVVADAEKGLIDKVPFQTEQNSVVEKRSEISALWTKDLNSQHQVTVKSYVTYFQQKQSANLSGIPVGLLDEDLLALYQLNPDAANALENGTFPSGSLTTEEMNLAVLISNRYPGSTALVPIAGTVNADLDEFRFDIEVQDTYIYSPTLTLVSGVSFRRDVVDSDHYFDGELYGNSTRVFGSATWQSSQRFNWHLGLMIEKEEFSDLVFSPRTALNYKLSPSESIRYVYSESVRSADFFEQFANWTFDVEGATPSNILNGNTFYQVGRGAGELDHQKIVSHEIGYYGHLNDYELDLDVRIFNENQSNVLYQALSIDDFVADTDNEIEHTGIEWQIEYQPFSKTRLRMTTAFVDINTSRENNGSELRIYAEKTGTLSWMQGWGGGVSSMLNYFVVSELDDANTSTHQYRIERLDGRLSKAVKIASLDSEFYLNFQHDLASSTYLWTATQYTDKTRLVLGASFHF